MPSVTCRCGTVLHVAPEMAGTPVFCPSCGQALTAPDAAASGPAFPAPSLQTSRAVPRPRGKTSAGVVIGIVAAGAFLVLLVCGGVFGAIVYNAQQVMHERKPLASRDGWTQITVPGHLNSQAMAEIEGDIKAGNLFAELYLVVVNEGKQDLPRGTSLDGYKSLIVDLMQQRIQQMRFGAWQNLTINGKPALQAEVHGQAEGVDIAYLVTFVESDRGFHQVLVWTLENRFPQQRNMMREMADSFRITD